MTLVQYSTLHYRPFHSPPPPFTVPPHATMYSTPSHIPPATTNPSRALPIPSFPLYPFIKIKSTLNITTQASLAQSVERETLNLKVAGSTPAWGFLFCRSLTSGWRCHECGSG
ncbi:hypothetical protein EX30DRAFT_39195 [Ascodesmis nigricans]|uniref:Uncharacterized protein n=1 Tax=Ascodesmis nigricans TaxID=341454 RepID=A0A4S2MVY6_9PEZI|nr:hypothetical protein EX30DRAFT_39195 [Ascodesmis nigricans]